MELRSNLLILFLCCTISVVSAQTQIVNCNTNLECQQSLGDGACCLYEDITSLNRTQYNCRNKDFVNYYLNPKNYNQISQVWTNPEDLSDSMKVYCRPLNTSTLPFKYPFMQKFAPNYTLPVIYDTKN